jgi:hypothetical protein
MRNLRRFIDLVTLQRKVTLGRALKLLRPQFSHPALLLGLQIRQTVLRCYGRALRPEIHAESSSLATDVAYLPRTAPIDAADRHDHQALPAVRLKSLVHCSVQFLNCSGIAPQAVGRGAPLGSHGWIAPARSSRTWHALASRFGRAGPPLWRSRARQAGKREDHGGCCPARWPCRARFRFALTRKIQKRNHGPTLGLEEPLFCSLNDEDTEFRQITSARGARRWHS